MSVHAREWTAPRVVERRREPSMSVEQVTVVLEQCAYRAGSAELPGVTLVAELFAEAMFPDDPRRRTLLLRQIAAA